MCLVRGRDYPAGTAAVSPARTSTAAFLVAALRPQGWAVADDAELVVSELMTGCLLTDAQRIHLDVQLHWNHVAVTVTDDRSATPRAQFGPLAEVRQRVLEALTSRTDVHRLGDGRTATSARLPCKPDYAGNVACELRPA